MSALLEQLRAVVGPARGTDDPGTDWLGRPRARVDAVTWPATPEQLGLVLRHCHAAAAVVVPVGGDTGLVGGTLPPDTDRPVVLVHTGRLDTIDVDATAGLLTAGAGATLAAVQHAAAAAGWHYGVDLAARESATIGGTVATNAGGIHVCGYGGTRAQLAGLQVVLADGTVVTDLLGLPKDNTGLDLLDLFCGSEGTLGIIATVQVRLHLPPGRLTTILLAAGDLAGALAAARRLAAVGRLHAVEFVEDSAWRSAAADLGLRDPLASATAPVRLLVELADADLDAIGDAIGAGDAAVGVDAAERRLLWQLRERQTEWWSQLRSADPGRPLVLHKFDICLPLTGIDAHLRRLRARLSAMAGVRRLGVFGHLWEGSLHLQVLTDPGVDPAAVVYPEVAALGGSISAEHGVGRDKAAWLPLRRSSAELAVQRSIKEALDPAGILNPGVILP